MSELTAMKKAFYREVVTHGIANPGQFREAFPLGYQVPQERMESWLRKFLRVRNGDYTKQARYVNHFKLGADPEFVFASKRADPEDDSGRINANAFALKQGPAFGVDNNGRLAEIRPYPSRSALEVCASTLTTLRWLAALKPETLECNWLAGAYIFRDGVGGHVHFGRKRPTRDIEVKGLDNICDLFLQLSIYPKNEVTARRRGDARGQRYGMPGDYRLQTHGYEYRTFPSWLDSPALAFLTLTVSKLAVHDPELAQSLQPGGSANRAYYRLYNLLAYFKGIDDDARLAFLMCQRGLPLHIGGDFKQRWGLVLGPNYTPPDIKIIPPSIQASDRDTREVFEHLKTGSQLTFRLPEPNWMPLKAPDGYVMCLERTETVQQKGLGELIWDICCPKDLPIEFYGAPKGSLPLGVSSKLADHLGQRWKQTLPMARVTDSDRARCLIISQDWREGQRVRAMRGMLLNGTLPLWDVRKVKSESYREWRESLGERQRNKFTGKVIYSEGKQPV